MKWKKFFFVVFDVEKNNVLYVMIFCHMTEENKQNNEEHYFECP